MATISGLPDNQNMPIFITRFGKKAPGEPPDAWYRLLSRRLVQAHLI